MSRVLLTPRWLALHALAIALVVTCGFLSYWQFLRAEAGNGRSLGYALQWPGFGVFVIGVWFWLARDAARAASGGGAVAAAEAAGRPVRVEHLPGRAPDDVVLPPAPSTAAERAAAGPGGAGPEATEDDELAAFNRLLARLHERDTT